MRHFLLRRLAAVPLILLVLSFLVFAATQVLPGDVGRVVLGREASDASVRRYDHQLGLDRPLVIQYGHWIGNFLTGDWGTSYTLHTPVRALLFDRLGQSLSLALTAFAVLVPVSLGLGLLAGHRHGLPLGRVLSTAGLGLGAPPAFVSAMILLRVFAVRLRWPPASAQTQPGEGPPRSTLRH